MRIWTFIIAMLVAAPLDAQRLELDKSLEKIASTAVSKVEIDLDAAMLNFASKILSDTNPEEAAAKKLIVRLQGIYVRTFNFAQPGAFDPADLRAVGDQLTNLQWARFVNTVDVGGPKKRRPDERMRFAAPNGEAIEVWMYCNCSEAARKSRGTEKGDVMEGMVLVSFSPTEVTVVNIVGPIRPEDFAALGGRFGIPKITLPAKKEDWQ